MNSAILASEVQDYITQNLGSDLTSLLFQRPSFDGVKTLDIIEQLESKRRSEKKLPTWFNCTNIYYPNKLNIEQTSSEETAEYKSQLIGGKTIIDITGGFGVDALYFAKHFENVTHCELNLDLSAIVKHNYDQLGISNIGTVAADGLAYLQNTGVFYDWIYVDPSRRHDQKGKVFFLKDCLPNIPLHLDVLWSHTINILIKTSPLLDISIGINELQFVKSIHIVALNNDVKELLWILEKNYTGNILIKTINLKKNTSENFEFILNDESQIETSYSKPLTYLYEPNAAIMKSGGFNSITAAYDVHKLHKHSHLYTSHNLIDFPGRTFLISQILPYNKKVLKKLSLEKANITTRNFPDSVTNIRKSLKIKDGGNHYLFFTTTIDQEKKVLICKKIEQILS